jgi:hypothetical protein
MWQVTPVPCFLPPTTSADPRPHVTPGRLVAVDPGDAAPVERAWREKSHPRTALLRTHHTARSRRRRPQPAAEQTVPLFGAGSERYAGTSRSGLRQERPPGADAHGPEFRCPTARDHNGRPHCLDVRPCRPCSDGDTLFSAGCRLPVTEGTAEHIWPARWPTSPVAAETLVILRPRVHGHATEVRARGSTGACGSACATPGKTCSIETRDRMRRRCIPRIGVMRL